MEGALPGEEVEAEILQDKKDFLRLRTVKVLKSSPHRVQAPCTYYGRCGGCQYQHVSYEEVLRLKGSQLRDVLQKIAGIKTDVPPLAHGADYGYRSSVTFHIGPREKNKAPHLCFVSKDNVSLIPVKNCALLQAPLQTVFEKPARITKGSEKVSFKLDEKNTLFSDQEELFFRVRLAGQTLVVNSKGFFQNNLAVTELLCRKVSQWVNELKPRLFYDLYAGVGTFSLTCAAGVPQIVCVEENPFAVAALQMNREEKKSTNMEIVRGRVEKAFPALWKEATADSSLVFMDPPRQGLEKKFAEFLSARCRAAAMIYVSCDVATLARDLKILLAGGCWEFRELAPFDMFPWTKHMEAAVLLTGNHGKIN